MVILILKETASKQEKEKEKETGKYQIQTYFVPL